MTKWVTKTLIQLADYHNGMAFKPSDWTETGVKIIRIEQLNNPLGKYDYYQGSYPEINAIHNGDLIFSWSATLKVSIWKWGEGVLNQHLFKVVPFEDVDKNFLYFLLDYNMPKLGESSHGSTMRHIKRKELETYSVNIPESLTEQRRIASILSSANGAIAASEALIAKYRNIKRGLLATLLQPKEGWKKVKLGECLTIGNGQDYKHLHKGDIPVYGTGGVMTYVDDYLFDGETVCIGRKGTINKPIFHCGKIWTVDTLFYTHSFVNVLPLFMYYAFCCIDWLRYNEATGVPSLSKETIYKIEINIPSNLTEQRRIAEILSSVDAKIVAEEKVVEKYKGVKKGLMEEMMNEK